MGRFQEYNKAGGFNSYDFVHTKYISVGNLSGEVLKKYNEVIPHTSLPEYSNTGKIYFKENRNGEIIQMRIYVNRKASLDFDWGHEHKNFSKGVVHVHLWTLDSKGKHIRNEPRGLMSNKEIELYGNILKKANPNIKFHN